MKNNNLTGKFFTVICDYDHHYHYRYLKSAIKKLKELKNNSCYDCIQIRYDDYEINNDYCVIGNSSPFIFCYKNHYDIFPNVTNYYKTTEEYKKLYSEADKYLKECVK